MRRYRLGRHAKYDLKVHLVWCPKYRKRVLTGPVATRVRDLLRQIAVENELRTEVRTRYGFRHPSGNLAREFATLAQCPVLGGKVKHDTTDDLRVPAIDSTRIYACPAASGRAPRKAPATKQSAAASP